MKGIAMMVGAAVLVGVAGTAAARSIEGARDIKTYEKAAGSEVTTMPASPMVNWQALDDHTLAVWTSHDKPWLVAVDPSCSGLMSAKNVAFTSRSNQITAGTDSLKLGNTDCKVESIKPVDYKQVAATHQRHERRERHHKMASSKKHGQ